MDVVVGDEDADVATPEVGYNLLNVFDGDWVYACKRLVEEDKGGVGDEGAGNFGTSSFSAGEPEPFVVYYFLETELFDKVVGFFADFDAWHAMVLENGLEVFAHGEIAEHAGFLGQVSNAETRTFVHGHMREALVVEVDVTTFWFYDAGEHVKGGGFSGAVRAEQSDDFSLAQADGHVVDNGSSAIAFDEVSGGKFL